MRSLPAYRIRHWRRVDVADPILRYRPSLLTFAQRLVVTLVCFLVAGGVEWSFQSVGFTPTATLLSRGAVVDLLSDTSRRLAAGQFPEVANLIELGRLSIISFLLFIGLIAPLSCLWNHVSVRLDRENELVIKSFFVLPRSAHWPLATFSTIRTFAIERYKFGEHGRLEGHYWEWTVQLSIKGNPQLPLPGSVGLAFVDIGPQFHVHRERFQPSMLGRAPEPVRELVKGLREITALPAAPPQLIEGRITDRGRVSYNATLQENAPEPVARYEGRVKAGEPLPEAIKAHLANMQGQSSGIERTASQRIEVTDANGQKHIYNSIDELPEEIRQRLGL